MKQFFETYKPEELVYTQRVINTPSDFARNSLFYVQETGYLKNLKCHLSERHNLNSFLFMIVLSGRGTFTYVDQSYFLNPSNCVLIDCRKHYTHISDISAPWELLWVHFNGLSAEAYYKYFQHIYNNVFHTENPDVYSGIIQQLIHLHQKKEASWEFMSSKLITDLLTNCMIKRKPDIHPESESINNKLYKVKDFLEQNYMNKIVLEDLENTFYISKYHLCREYKKLFGVTVLDSITMKRITHAKELLRFTKKSIENIAADSGYPDSSYFNKVFQRVEGMTASEYRKRW